ncbi:hypothetical protein [Microbacterium candidum]|uniref:DUF2530 domain-containing protein n=1 Tax=Microbacterium candidum TaxID=3041922 RepID=A0ABT7MU25_9MICO|nr:hypothetical protein [Microbacterium sp. ASV49]MDL9977948.1 hypothetical protein [Microbacterium sp. ASV49]
MRRNYWVYSVGLAVAWAIIFVIVAIVDAQKLPTFALVFAGFAICWISATIARYVYPPPVRWKADKRW